MKIRTGFVSNSSSSSFVCDNCNTIYEFSTDDIYRFSVDEEIYTCENGHIITETDIYDTNEKSRYNDEGLIEECCPICCFDVGNKKDLRRYLLKTTKYTEQEVLQHIISNQSTLSDKKKLQGTEYVDYVLVKKRKTEIEVLKELRDKFKTYKEFLDYLRTP
jgi:hypothetical protein